MLLDTLSVLPECDKVRRRTIAFPGSNTLLITLFIVATGLAELRRRGEKVLCTSMVSVGIL